MVRGRAHLCLNILALDWWWQILSLPALESIADVDLHVQFILYAPDLELWRLFWGPHGTQEIQEGKDMSQV